jgi:hypothetical protein
MSAAAVTRNALTAVGALTVAAFGALLAWSVYRDRKGRAISDALDWERAAARKQAPP